MARGLWEAGQDARGSPVERYLRSRGIEIPPPPCLRWASACRHPSGRALPAMLARIVRAVIILADHDRKAPASARPALRRPGGCERPGGCGSRCRPRLEPTSPTCCTAEPMPPLAIPAMPPRDPEAVRRIVDMAEDVLPRLRPLSAAELLMLELPPRALILDPILPQKGLMLLHAYRGVGKTHLALGIGYCAATGGGMLGWSASRPHPVLYIDGEMPADAMQARLAAIIEGADKQPSDPGYFTLLSADLTKGGLPDLGGDEGQSEIDAAIARAGAELVIVDNCSTLIRSGKEN